MAHELSDQDDNEPTGVTGDRRMPDCLDHAIEQSAEQAPPTGIPIW